VAGTLDDLADIRIEQGRCDGAEGCTAAPWRSGERPDGINTEVWGFSWLSWAVSMPPAAIYVRAESLYHDGL
jgi:hypothetical protein